jgi:hypothetical protein
MRRAIALGIFMLPGCAAYTPVDVANPSNISLTQATTQIADSLVAMKRRLDDKRVKLGLIIDQVDVDLNVTASATAGGSQDLKIDAAKTALAGVGLSANVSGQQTSTGSRQNTIRLRSRT